MSSPVLPPRRSTIDQEPIRGRGGREESRPRKAVGPAWARDLVAVEVSIKPIDGDFLIVTDLGEQILRTRENKVRPVIAWLPGETGATPRRRKIGAVKFLKRKGFCPH